MSALIQLACPRVSEPPPQADFLVDSFGRVHSDLRISVTDRCNIRCFYCMPAAGAQFAPFPSLLTFAEIERTVRIAASLGIRKIRLTGGEPLLRPRLPDLVAALSRIDGIQDLALTTNAILLADHAEALYQAGLQRLNIHLDTLDRERFRQVSRRDDLTKVLAGIEAARRAGFQSIKLNAVAIKNFSEPDLAPLVRFARDRHFEVRFIEFMPLDAQNIWSLDQVLTARDMICMLEDELGQLTAVPDADPRAPATEYQLENGQRIGFIASISRPFCLNCNRLRLTADGKVRNCLFAREELDLKPLLTNGSDPQIADVLRTSVWSKWIGHQIDRSSFQAPQRPMYSIGG